MLRKSIFTNPPIPIAQRSKVVSHRKFYDIDREAAENILMHSTSEDFIARPSSLGPDCLAITLLSSKPCPNKNVKSKISSHGFYLYHLLLSPDSFQRSYYAESPIDEFINYLDKMGFNISLDKKEMSIYLQIMQPHCSFSHNI